MAELQAAKAALVEQATHDALTGLPNRALLVDRTSQALAQAQHSGRCTAILYVDLDRFKHVNDTHGHAAGDTMLRRVARQLVATMRQMDTVARIAYYQPIVDLTAGFEALARIAERDESILPPAAFIGVAEDSGLVVTLGGQVLAMACQEAGRWLPPGLHPTSALPAGLSTAQLSVAVKSPCVNLKPVTSRRS